MSDILPTTTASTLPVIPPPTEESFETNLTRKLKRPEVEKFSLKTLQDIPDNVDGSIDPSTPVFGFDEVPEQTTAELLKTLEGAEIEKKKEKAVKETNNDFSIDDIDLTKDPDPIAETKTKKTKEDNIAELRKKAESFEETLKGKDSEVAQYREKLEKLEAELERTAFERSPKFKEKYEAPYQEAVNEAAKFAQEIGGDSSIAERALSLKGKERIEFIDENFAGSAAFQFSILLNQADEKRTGLEKALQDNKATAQEIAVDSQAKNEQTTQTIKANFDKVKAHLANKLDYFRPTGDPDADKLVQQRIDRAYSIVDGTANQNEIMVAPFLAQVAEEAVEEVANLKAQLAKYKSRAAQDAAVQPRISRGSTDDGEVVRQGKPKSALQAIRDQLR